MDDETKEKVQDLCEKLYEKLGPAMVEVLEELLEAE